MNRYFNRIINNTEQVTKQNNLHKTIAIICQIAIFATILVIQKFALSFIPNVQLTFFFIMLFSATLGFKKTCAIIIIYYFVDCAIFGSWNPIFLCFQLFAWLLIPILMCTLFKKVENPLLISLIAFILSLIYSWILIIPSIILYQVDFTTYLLADLPFEAILGTSSFVSCLVLFNPLRKVLNRLLERYS